MKLLKDWKTFLSSNLGTIILFNSLMGVSGSLGVAYYMHSRRFNEVQNERIEIQNETNELLRESNEFLRKERDKWFNRYIEKLNEEIRISDEKLDELEFDIYHLTPQL